MAFSSRAPALEMNGRECQYFATLGFMSLVIYCFILVTVVFYIDFTECGSVDQPWTSVLTQ